jgi:hypothetical protein
MRPATYDDLPQIAAAGERLAVYATKYGWVGKVDYQQAITNLMAYVEQGKAYVVGGYIVFIDEIQPWWSPIGTKVLQEWLVMRVGNTVPEGVNVLPTALLEIAASRGCVGVLGGDSSPVSIVAKAYEDAGWQSLTKSFYKEVTNGVR